MIAMTKMTINGVTATGAPEQEQRTINAIEEQIKTALDHLDVKGKIKISPAGYHRYRVEVNGEYFGIYDIDRNTFVD